jgi:hypothetical protein
MNPRATDQHRCPTAVVVLKELIELQSPAGRIYKEQLRSIVEVKNNETTRQNCSKSVQR